MRGQLTLNVDIDAFIAHDLAIGGAITACQTAFYTVRQVIHLFLSTIIANQKKVRSASKINHSTKKDVTLHLLSKFISYLSSSLISVQVIKGDTIEKAEVKVLYIQIICIHFFMLLTHKWQTNPFLL